MNLYFSLNPIFFLILLCAFFLLFQQNARKKPYKNLIKSFFIAYGFALGALANTTNQSSFEETKYSFCLHLVTCLFLTYGFFTFINLLLTSLRIRILLTLLKHSSLGCLEKTLKQSYSANKIAKKRIHRLKKWNQIIIVQNKVRINRELFWFINQTLYFYKKRILKLS